MKLERVALRGFLSHADTDWSPNGARLVSIVGANGAGKSSLAVDGPLFALYDDARGRTDDLVSLGATDMSARVEFSFSGNTYAVERGRTRKAGGKSYLELQMAVDGGWMPLTGDTICDTQQAIVELLRMDAKAFETSVVLGQGHAMAFAEATAAERKRILGQVLDLEVYARAEARSRELARDLDARTAVERDRIDRLAGAIAELEPSRAVAVRRAAEIHEIAQAQTTAATERDRIGGRLTELAGEIAKGDTAAVEVTRLEAERATLADRYRRERATIASADAVLRVRRTWSPRPPSCPSGALRSRPWSRLRGRTGRLASRSPSGDARSTRSIASSPRVARPGRPGCAAHRRASPSSSPASTRSKPVICRQCGTANVVDQAGLTEQLADTRFRAKALEANEPTEPMSLSRERVAIKRLEERRAEDVFDRIAFVQLQTEVTALERVAARGEAIGTATTARADAEAELVRIRDAGEALAARIAEAKAATSWDRGAARRTGLGPGRADDHR